MKSIFGRMGRLHAAVLGLVAVLAFGSVRAQGQPTLVSVNPTNGATGVATSSQVVFTFDRAMSSSSFLVFSNLTAGTIVAFGQGTLSAGGTVITYTPTPSWPANAQIGWDLSAVFDTSFQTIDSGVTSGSFTTGTGGGGTGGTGTNKLTSFALFKSYTYDQTSSAAPTLETNYPFGFIGGTILSSNRTATNITLTIPVTGGVSNLTQNFLRAEQWNFYYLSTNQATFEGTVPQGSYTFTVKAATSNQTVSVNFPSSMAQPNAPHLTNYAAAQAVDPSKAFTLYWDAFTSATSTDFVQVIVASGGTNVFQTPDYTASNALPGTAVSVSIPAGTLKSNLTYAAQIMFARASFVTNNPGYVTSAVRATVTYFPLATVGGATGPLVFTNVVKSAGSLAMDVLCSAGQTFTVITSTNAALPVAQWTTLLTTNPTGSRVHYVDPQPATNRSRFYRARSGS